MTQYFQMQILVVSLTVALGMTGCINTLYSPSTDPMVHQWPSTAHRTELSASQTLSQRTVPNEWKRSDMNPRSGNSVKVSINPESSFCFSVYCAFEMSYLTKGPLLPTAASKAILFIPGGPGAISNPDYAKLLVNDYSLFFDIRGSGNSEFPRPREYDKYLRARYVVEDIERLRHKYFNECEVWETKHDKCKETKTPTPWDAIYAHSWGTVVAQMYAWKYPNSVKKLILSAPVSRGHGGTEAARRKVIVTNLVDVFETYREVNCYRLVKNILKNPTVSSDLYDFCFVSKRMIAQIAQRLITLLNQIEEDYGSITFVNERFDSLVKEGDLHAKFPYPKHVFAALRQLEMLGGAEIGGGEGLKFSPANRDAKIVASYVLGYYLSLPPDQLLTHANNPAKCLVSAPFFQDAPSSERNIVRRLLCEIIGAEAWRVAKESPSLDRSKRANLVFGVYDGVARWILRILREDRRLDRRGCFGEVELNDMVKGFVRASAVAVETIKELEIVKGETVCPWDPGKYKHDVPTLILSGGSDPVTAGGQARYLFDHGLMPGQGILMEFPGLGHEMELQVPAGMTANKVLSDIIGKFSRLAVEDFAQNAEIKLIVERLKVNMLVNF